MLNSCLISILPWDEIELPNPSAAHPAIQKLDNKEYPARPRDVSFDIGSAQPRTEYSCVPRNMFVQRAQVWLSAAVGRCSAAQLTPMKCYRCSFSALGFALGFVPHEYRAGNCRSCIFLTISDFIGFHNRCNG